MIDKFSGMAGKELGFLKPSVPNLKQQLARKTLRNVRLQGHTYVDLREDGKRYIFFCTLCLAPCYSDGVLFDHLRGNLHKERFSAAKVTLMGQNPWPFDDGVLFFCNSDKEETDVAFRGNGKINLLDDQEHVGDLAIVVHSKASNGSVNGLTNGNGNPSSDILAGNCSCDDQDMGNGEGADCLVIPGVIGKEEVADLRVRLMGYGQISASFSGKDGIRNGMRRIWCEWLGRKTVDDDDKILVKLPSLDFAIVTFGYYYDLGKQGLFDDIKMLLLTDREDSGTGDGSGKRRKKSVSDTENGSETLSYQCDSSGEDSHSSSTATSSALVLHRIDDQLLQSRIISSKSLRRELRRQQRVASEKMCDICQHKMLPGKDVATLLNMKTGTLACSSRNVHGAFHVFHISCLIHWILLCEFEMFTNPPVHPKVRRKSKRRVKSMVNQLGKQRGPKVNGVKRNQSKKETDAGTLCPQIHSVFCPDCQGTGLQIEEGELEKPTVPLSQMFKYKIKVSDAHRAWMKCPEELENCSTGFAFSFQADDAQEKVSPMNLLRFYRADEEGWHQ